MHAYGSGLGIAEVESLMSQEPKSKRHKSQLRDWDRPRATVATQPDTARLQFRPVFISTGANPVSSHSSTTESAAA